MQITYNGGKFYCDASRKAGVMNTHKWKWDDDIEMWFTSVCEKVEPLYTFCSAAAKKQMDSWRDTFLEEIKDSFALNSKLKVKAPEGEEYLNYQVGGIEYAENHDNHILIADPPGLGKTIQGVGYNNHTYGKAQPLHSKVLTPNGWRTMGSLKLGSFISNPAGGVQWVSGIFEQGVLDNYRVEFHDGTSAECCDHHLWMADHDGDEEILPLRDIITGMQAGKSYYIPTIIAHLSTAQIDLMVDPYIIGVVLAGKSYIDAGDDNAYILCETDDQICTVIGALETKLDSVEHCLEVDEGVMLSRTPHTKDIYQLIQQWNCYIDADVDVEQYASHMELLTHKEKTLVLQGYLDAVGAPKPGYSVEAPFVSSQATRVIKGIVNSFGGVCIDNEATLIMTLPWDMDPFQGKHAAKYNADNDTSYQFYPRKKIINVVPLNPVPMRCISVSGPDKLYVTDDYIVTHNTSSNVRANDAHGVLVICPATLKANWIREWLKWDVHGLTVAQCESKLRTKTITNADGEKHIQRWTEDIFPDTEVVICNYEQMEKYDLQLKARKWALVIVDECDRLRNTKSKQNKVFFGGEHKKKDKDTLKVTKKKFRGIDATKILFLTGTPIPKSPIDMWPIIQVCDPHGLGKSWKNYVHRYCDAKNDGFGLNVKGASNLEELQFKMRKTFMVRRDKREALPDLPESRRQILFLPSDGLNKQIQYEFNIARKGVHEFEKMMGLRPNEDPLVIDQEHLMEFMKQYHDHQGRMTYEQAVDKASNTALDFAFEEFAEARQQLATAKIPMMVERIKAALEENESIVFFGVHHEFIQGIANHFDNYAMVTGRVPIKKRQPQVDLFQNDQDCRIFFGNIHAAGVGLTLTKAWWTMFGELAWNETEVSQAEQRTWRIGQKNNCLAQHMIVENSLDARFVPILYEKKDIGERALDINRLNHTAIFGQRSFG